jgi:hypothetical protein
MMIVFALLKKFPTEIYINFYCNAKLQKFYLVYLHFYAMTTCHHTYLFLHIITDLGHILSIHKYLKAEYIHGITLHTILRS